MRRFLKFLLFLMVIGSGAAAYYFYWPSEETTQTVYETESPETRSIVQAISAPGELDIKDRVKVGTLVSGIVKAIYVQENQEVKEGQLMAEIDTGRDDTDVREAQGEYEKALAELEYEEGEYRRYWQLMQEKLIAEIKFQEVRKSYLLAQSNVKITKAIYDRKLKEFQNNAILAPTSGIITAVNVIKGEYMSADGSTAALFHIAPDVTKMEATLTIDERDIGQIQLGQKVELVVDTYPNKIFESTIQNISFSPNGLGESSDQAHVYEAKAYVDNPKMLLRPGMRVNATIYVASVESALAITSRTLLIKKDHLEKVAQLINFDIKPLDKQKKQTFIVNDAEKNIQFVWKVCDNCFVETPVEVGITDNIYFEVKTGLDENDELVLEVPEEDAMQDFYDQAFNRGL